MNEHVVTVFERAWANLSRVWQSISQAGRSGFERLESDLPERDVSKLRGQIEECLVGKGGEVSSRARAAAIGHLYLTLSDRGRQRFLRILAHDFGIDRQLLADTMKEFEEATSDADQIEIEQRLRQALAPRHLKLLTQFNSLPAGVKFLVDLRADVRRFDHLSDPRLRRLEQDLRDLLASWFDVGFLDLRRITWNSSAALLERLIAYEAVHEIESWEELKRRLDDDRRCFAFFHPRMPDEPLIFIEVALVEAISDNVQALLGDTKAQSESEQPGTAIFYSISNTQRGLAGINLGSFLIKRVADELLRELPMLKTFATLSPVPGFERYLNDRLREEIEVTPTELDLLMAIGGGSTPSQVIVNLLHSAGWHRNERASKALRGPLLRLCAQYLVVEPHTLGRAPDRVANFHLSNGARIERINWLADTSSKGLKQSSGMMVNYLYELDAIEANHENYRTTGDAVVSADVRALLSPPLK